MPPEGTTAVKVPLALDAALCTDLPAPCQHGARLQQTLNRLVASLDEILGFQIR
jgi:hypothetical protein